MKKAFIITAVLFSFSILFTACKETKKEDAKEDTKIESQENHEHDKEITSKDVYQCPMDCEKGKTYDKEGKCPVCNMDLKLKKVDAEDNKQALNCKCLDGEECICEGKCECKEIAVNNTACNKCESGKCECKAEEVIAQKSECKKCEPGKCVCKA